MALYRTRLVWRMNSGVPDDRAVWSWGMESASTPDPAALSLAFDTAWRTGSASSEYLRTIITNRLYSIGWEVMPAGGGPVAAYLQDDSHRGGGGSMLAPQTTMAITPQVATTRSPANRSRWLVGPMGVTAASGRPTSVQMTACLNFAAEWHRQLLALGITPVVLRQDGTIGTPIVSYSIGNSFGMLKSRRWTVTQRDTVIP